jgi:hypothetical protein
MRLLLAIAAFAALTLGIAHAEKRLFIIANEADGYGVDNCLATGAPCGIRIRPRPKRNSGRTSGSSAL